MAKRIGPQLTIEASCFDCEHCRSVSYQWQGDSGKDVSCAHPERSGEGGIGDTTWKTPAWCPLYKAALAKLLAEHQPTTKSE